MQPTEFMRHTGAMSLADEIATYSSCEMRQVGCVILAGDSAVFAWNHGAVDDGHAHHAEMRCLEKMRSRGLPTLGATVYVTCRPCMRCSGELLAAGVAAVYYRDPQPDMTSTTGLGGLGVRVDGGWKQRMVQTMWAIDQRLGD